MVYLVGDTIRLTAEFRDWDGVLKNPTEIKLKILDSKYNELESHDLGLSNNESVGKYFFDYPASLIGDFIYEWEALADGTPNVYRSQFKVRMLV